LDLACLENHRALADPARFLSATDYGAKRTDLNQSVSEKRGQIRAGDHTRDNWKSA
jgi:hypothetical protein